MTDDLSARVSAICADLGESEYDVLNATTLACDGDKAHYDDDAHYWRKWLKITVQPSGRQLVW